MCLLFSAASEGRIRNLGLGGKIGTFLGQFWYFQSTTLVPFGTKSRIRDLSGPPEKFVHNFNGRAVFHEKSFKKWESSTLHKSGGHSIVREKISLRAGHSPSSDKNPATGFSLEEVFLAQAGLQVHSPPDWERSGALQQQQRRFPCWAEHCQVAPVPLQCCSTYYLTCYLADRHNTEIIQLTRWLITPGSLVDLEQHLGKFKLILASV